MDNVALAVLACYPAELKSARREFLGNRGGFSGALLWRLHTAHGLFCLRCAASHESSVQLEQRHRLMVKARSADLTFVPAVLASQDGPTLVEQAGRYWELMQWLPGSASFREAPSLAKLRQASQALARLHLAWEPVRPRDLPCPGVLRRLELLHSWREPATINRSPLFERLQNSLRRWLPQIEDPLRPWLAKPMAIQACLRDIWHDHLLFEGDRLSGIVDYAAVELDNVAADLARMLGSLVGDDEANWQVALQAYREVRNLSVEEEQLSRVLDRTGVIASLANWLQQLTTKVGPVDKAERVEQRVEELLSRVEHW
jgi:Ser/Thr protein kinase RdoA (MazF antagonist)